MPVQNLSLRANRSLDLSDVTLVAVTSIAIDATAQAVARCLDTARFCATLWLSDVAPPLIVAKRVSWRRVAPIRSRHEYSRILLRDLHLHVESTHALCVQWDGFILDPTAWDDTFLDYDYIGAPWPWFDDGHDVGNGGFSLRSKRLLEACATLPETAEVEDVAICRVHRERLEHEHKIRFAPADLAARFSFERLTALEPTFGFHGPYNLVKMIGDAEAAHIFAGLEPHVMAPLEHREIASWALRNRHWRLLCAILRRWRRFRHQH